MLALPAGDHRRGLVEPAVKVVGGCLRPPVRPEKHTPVRVRFRGGGGKRRPLVSGPAQLSRAGQAGVQDFAL